LASGLAKILPATVWGAASAAAGATDGVGGGILWSEDGGVVSGAG